MRLSPSISHVSVAATTRPAVIGQRLGDRKLASGQLGDQFGVVHKGDGVAGSSQVAGVEWVIFDRVSAVNPWIVERTAPHS